MTKIYKAGSCLALNITLPSGQNMHISFTALSNGTSEYLTSNADIQKGLEHSSWFGKLFRLAGIVDETKKTEEKKAAKEAEQSKEPSIIKVKVSDLSSAKDYLATNFGVARTTLRLKTAILECAKAHNILFEGIE